MDYFGARYLNIELSIWLSVDPLASKYPTGPINNTNTVKVKISTQYMLPYRRRE